MLERQEAINLLTAKYRARRFDKAHAIIFTFPNGKQIATENTKAENQRKTFSLVVDSLPPKDVLLLDPVKFYPRGVKDRRANHNITQDDAPTLYWQDYDTWRIYPETRLEFEAFLRWYFDTNEDADSTSPSSNITAPPTTPKILRDEQPEQALDEDIDSASKLEYPIEGIQQRAIRTRRGQPDFRKRMLVAYGNKCSVTGCEVQSVLEAAHIIPHAEGTDWDIGNGLPLRADIHTLFDLRLLSVSPDYRIHISRELAGSDYGNLHGKTINLPGKERHYPTPEKLAKHFEGFEARNTNK
ncbi:MAG: HNH endonuclease [Thiobacillus sp.]|nr:HNH endonuclease [Thiobacillus sp.]MDP2977607.1 HNH endonuclease [Thiobacillus sp.]